MTLTTGKFIALTKGPQIRRYMPMKSPITALHNPKQLTVINGFTIPIMKWSFSKQKKVPQKWMVQKSENPTKMDDNYRGTPF